MPEPNNKVSFDGLNDTSSNTSFDEVQNIPIDKEKSKKDTKKRKTSLCIKNEKDPNSFLKKCIKECGIYINYKTFLKDFDTEKKIKEKLRLYLKEIGIKDRISLSACKKLRKKLDLQKELKDLEVDEFSGKYNTTEIKQKRSCTLKLKQTKNP
ncbi:hypothetical protein MXB_1145 [Myxobolus squamalis]|nr:hypothetical protein MXB_1145 [Myxobolus squamalis]